MQFLILDVRIIFFIDFLLFTYVFFFIVLGGFG